MDKTLRDEFAMQALVAILIGASGKDVTATMLYTSNGYPIQRDSYARTAYQYADAMLRAREST